MGLFTKPWGKVIDYSSLGPLLQSVPHDFLPSAIPSSGHSTADSSFDRDSDTSLGTPRADPIQPFNVFSFCCWDQSLYRGKHSTARLQPQPKPSVLYQEIEVGRK